MQEKNNRDKNAGRLMSYEEKRAKVQQFNLTSDIFFGKVMEDRLACQELIRILTKEKLKVKNVKTQYSIRNVENHSVVLDVLAEDENGKLVNVEIHPQENEDHVRRVRYYLGSIDVSFLEKGVSFRQLPEIIMIYITEQDFIGHNKGIYHVDRVLHDCGEILDNGVHEMYVNLQAEAGEKEQRELLRYIKCSDRSHETLSFPHLAERVNALKEAKGVEIMCDIINRERAEARAEAAVYAIRKKYQKQLEPNLAAEMLELEPEYVERVMNMLKSNPGATDMEIALEIIQTENA